MPAFAKGCKPPKDLARRAKLSSERYSFPAFAGLVLPSGYDLRTLGLVTPIKNQKQCGSCWDFSGVAACESAAILAGKGTAATVNWSEQSVLDCGSNGGCNGDWPESVFEQAKNAGVADTSDYPYSAAPAHCKNVPHPNTVQDYGYVGSSDAVPGTDAIKQAMLLHGVISCAVAADDAWSNYQPGTVFLDSGSTNIDHAIDLVGWQDYDATHPAPPGSRAAGYWILRNHWDTSWGNQGYMNIEYGANQVGYGAMWVTCGAAPPPPAPGPSPVPSETLTGSTTPATVTVSIPTGLFGRSVSVPVTIPALAVTVSANGPAPAPVPPAPAPTPSVVIPWAVLIPLILKYGSAIVPVVIADLAAKKTFAQILADIAAAVFPAPTATRPCGCK